MANKEIPELTAATLPLGWDELAHIVQSSNSRKSSVGDIISAGWKKGTDVASAATLTLGTNASYFDITGTTTVTSIVSTVAKRVLLQFDGAVTLTHSADLVLPGAANITTAAGDHAEFVEYATGDWRCVSYERGTGKAVTSSAWEHISTRGLSGSAAVDFTDLANFALLKVTGYLAPSASGSVLRLRTSTNNGSSFDAGASDYTYQYDRGTAGTPDAGQSTAAAFGLASPFTVGNSSGYLTSFTMNLAAFNKALPLYYETHAISIDAAGNRGVGNVGGTRQSAAARNAFRLDFDSGTASGFLILEGVRG